VLGLGRGCNTGGGWGGGGAVFWGEPLEGRKEDQPQQSN
jgi:hypothetical protein